MRTRRNSVGLWLSDAELTHLRQQCQITGLNTNTYLRKLIMGEHLCPRPPDAYAALLRELSAIGNNINQIRALGKRKRLCDASRNPRSGQPCKAGVPFNSGHTLMAYDKIITIRARLDDCLRYIQDGDKTALSRALDYIEDFNKTALDDEVILQSAINCTVENCYLDMRARKSGLENRAALSAIILSTPTCRVKQRQSWRMKREWNLHAVCSVTNMKPSFAPISTRNTCTAILYSTLFHSWME